jgi:hypothetical protein
MFHKSKSYAETSSQLYWTSGVHVNFEWTWSGVSRPFNYTYWARNEPNQYSSDYQSCVLLTNGYMYDERCDLALNYFICEENCPSPAREIKTIDTKDLVDLGGRNYYFSLYNVSSYTWKLTIFSSVANES